MYDSLENHVEDSGTSNLIREAEQAEAAEGMGSMPCQNSVTDAGGDNIMSTAEQEFLEEVLRIMNRANYKLHKYAGIRAKVEYFEDIREAWEDLTGKRFVTNDSEELGEEEEVEEEEEEEEEEKIMKGEI